MHPSLIGLDHLVLTVASINTSVRFYTDILGMGELIFQGADGASRVALSFGTQKINLHPAEAPFEPKATQALPGSADLCFLSQTPIVQWQAHLAHHGVEIIEGPVERTGATGPILSIYIRDPDGNLIEIAKPLP